MKRAFVAFAVAGAFLFILSLRIPQGAAQEKGPGMAPRPVDNAVAVLHPTEGNAAHGTVRFSRVQDGVRIVAEIQGLTPGKHGFHIHEYGDCSAPNAASAGGHYNPLGKPHAGPEAENRHVGDLGNVVADAQGRAFYDRVDKHAQLTGPYSVLGRAVVVHAGEDDLSSQPSGDAGARAACGVIGISKPGP